MNDAVLDDLPQWLTERLRHPLPGPAAQRWFQPELSFGRHFGPAPASARCAAVLALLYPQEGHWRLPLTLRPAHMIDHASQVSLPGGLIEPGERSSDAALRELQEELGVETGGVRLLGELSGVYLYASNFQVTPWVGGIDGCPQWRPNSAEVAELIEVPLERLSEPSRRGSIELERHGVKFTAPCFHWQSHAIWGATSMILAELLAVIGEREA
jgi:8-oxo-dGTP pyrophosphatase MutT (NUDIX family)